MKKYLALLSVIAMVNVAAAHGDHHNHGHHHHSHSFCGNQPCDNDLDLDGSSHYQDSKTCAVLYKYAGYRGPALKIYDNTNISSIANVVDRYVGNWNNEISSLVVNQGCTLKVYQYNNFGIHYRTGERIGASQTYFGYDRDYELSRLDEKISSLSCSCN